jgi:negative regulator of genetic competence, sporulation and motility
LEGHNIHPLQQGSKQLLGQKQEKQVGQEESDSFSDIQEVLFQKDKKNKNHHNRSIKNRNDRRNKKTHNMKKKACRIIRAVC